MKLYAPKYYNDFKCIADKCKHSCCIGWEIDVDDETLDKYQTLDQGYGISVKNSIDTTDVPHFILGKNDRCPHLNEKGLCNIILEMGEDMLCEICREHPRFYNDVGGHKEVGIGMSCEEAARIILSSDEYDIFCHVDSPDLETEDVLFDSVSIRNEVYSTLKNAHLPYQERLGNIAQKFDISSCVFSSPEWINIIKSLEYLDERDKDLFLKFSADIPAPVWAEGYLEKAFAYFVFRHSSPAQNEHEFRAGIGFALFCERLLVSILPENTNEQLDTIINYARIVSEEIEYSVDNTELIKSIFLF